MRNCARLLTGVIIGIATFSLSSMGSNAQNVKNMTLGQAHYLGHCASCHGLTGAGDGPSATGMNPPPTNFRSATPATLPDNAIEQALLAGKTNTPMRSYATIFRSDDIREIVTFLRSLSTAQ